MEGRFRRPTVACLGLTFKANVDDIRESPAIDVVHEIASALPETEILVADPYVRTLPPQLNGNGNLQLAEAADAVNRSDIIVLLVEHEAFRPLRHMQNRGKVVYDTRGAWA